VRGVRADVEARELAVEAVDGWVDVGG